MVIDDLQTILNRLERRLTAEIATAQTVYGPEAASDPHRGLYLSETEVERSLDRQTLTDFIAVEAPSSGIDGQYARVLATLRQPQYPESLYQLAGKIIADGVEHFSKFSEVQTILSPYHRDPEPNNFVPPYLRNITPAPSDNAEAQQALTGYYRLLANLGAAYQSGDMEDAGSIVAARQEMIGLDVIAKQIALTGLGIPFF